MSRKEINSYQGDKVHVLTQELGQAELDAALKAFRANDIYDLTWRQAKQVIKSLTGVKRTGISLLDKKSEKKKAKRSYVYFISNGRGHVKIGISVNPGKRLIDLQVSNPDKLTLLGVRLGSRKLEKQLHEKFVSFRTSGEWFVLNDEIRNEINPGAKKSVRITGTITKPQYNYIKGLIERVGQEFYYEMRVKENIIVGTTEEQLSKKAAMGLISSLKTRADEIKVGQVPRVFDVSSSLVEFEIETSYNTTMEAGTEKVLLDWASKRFKRDLPSLKKIKAFIADKRSATVDVPQYRIKRRLS